MARTPADVECCPYCGGEIARSFWERKIYPDWVMVCSECGEAFAVKNKWLG